MAQFFMEQGDFVSLEVVTASNWLSRTIPRAKCGLTAFISMTARMIKALNQQNHADLLFNLRSPEEKKTNMLWKQFHSAACLAFVRLLEAI